MLVVKSTETTEISIVSTDDVDTVTRVVRQIACSFGFSNLDANLIASATSELAMNIVLHAYHGTVCVDTTENARGLQIVFIDEGPGISDLEQARVAGYSSRANGLGLGLAAACKAVEQFEIFSEPGQGTTVIIRHYIPPKIGWFDVGIMSVADDKYMCNGDVAYTRVVLGDTQLLAVIDGMGQGERARAAAVCARKALEESSSTEPVELVNQAHFAVGNEEPEGGFAISLLQASHRELRLVSVGDIACRVFSAETGLEPYHFSGSPGTLGCGQDVKLIEQHIDISTAETALIIVITSSGISTDFVASGEPVRGDSIDIAHGLLHSFRCSTDDATVAVLRIDR